ncbi:MAG: hypothetical protein ABSD88_15130 [Candidatus Korobacteraceae bacterium]|jgi:hypothetical protein
MKLTTSTVLAAALLAGSLLANAQTQTLDNQDHTRSQSMASPAMSGAAESFSGEGLHPMVGAPAIRQDGNSKPTDQKQARPDYKKSPYWDPKDFTYLESQIGG